MEKPIVKIKLLPGGKMPVKKTAGAAAFDCYARIKKLLEQIMGLLENIRFWFRLVLLWNYRKDTTQKFICAAASA